MSKTPKKTNLLLKFLKVAYLPLTLFIILIILIIMTYQVILADKFLIFTLVGDTNVSILTQNQAIRAYEGKFDKRSQAKLNFVTPQNSFTIDLATASAKIDYSSLYQTFDTQHNLSILDKLQKQIVSIFYPQHISLKIDLSLETQLDEIAQAVKIDPQDAQITFDETTTSEGTPSANIQIKEAVTGLSLDKEVLKINLVNFLLTGKYSVNLPLKTTMPKISTDQVKQAKSALESIVKEPIKFTFEKKDWTLDAKQLLTLLDLSSGKNLLDKNQAESYLKTIALEIDLSVQEGLFEFDSQNKKVVAFKPSQEGRKLDISKTFILLSNALKNNYSKNISLPVEIKKPKIQTSDVNNLGIKELIGQGISNFAHSIPNRIYNVNLTAKKINGVLVPPGGVFSFNQTVGDITAATGFKQAYVIKEGRTVLDDGGGVCQGSTTLFRAVLNAGLPVIKRTAHAYRVGYYEQGFPPGLDATIFYPSVDFQFKNDSANYILIQAYTQGLTLFVDLYGTLDGRAAKLSTPIVTNRTPAPPDLRQDDPSLPKGEVKQIDFAASGATVSFNRTVTKAGAIIVNETWKSNYKAWQAIYLVGTKE